AFPRDRLDDPRARVQRFVLHRGIDHGCPPVVALTRGAGTRPRRFLQRLRHDRDGARRRSTRRCPSFLSSLLPGSHMPKSIPLILAVVTTNAISQMLLKQGMNTIGKFDFNGGSLFNMFPVVALNPYVIGGLAVLVFSMGLHLMALSRVDLSFAYPFLSVSYI